MQRICTRTAECTLCKQWYWNWESRMGYQVKMDKEKLSFFTNIQTYRYRSWQPRPDRPAPDLRGGVLGCVTYCSIRRHIRPSCWTRPGAGDAATGETVSWDEATWRWQLLARARAIMLTIQITKHAPAITFVLRDILALVPSLMPLISQLPWQHGLLISPQPDPASQAAPWWYWQYWLVFQSPRSLYLVLVRCALPAAVSHYNAIN